MANANSLRAVGLALVLMCTLTACVSERVSPRSMSGSSLDQARGPEQNAKLYTDLIRKLIDQDRLYAALAHLQEREQEFGVSDELRLLRADILRKMGNHDAAEALYTQLLDTPYAGEANHGLGLIYAPEDMARGIGYLQRAVDQAPTNAKMRNDLGYALLRQGRVADARTQLTTAFQLDENNELNRNNYILLLLAEGRSQRAGRIAAQSGVPSEVMDELRSEAQLLRQPGIGDVQPLDAGIAQGVRQRPATATQRTAGDMAVGGGGG